MPPNFYALTVLWEDPNPLEGADPHLHSLLRERCVFWMWAKHSIWQFIKELRLPKGSEAEGPVGQGSVALRRGTGYESRVSHSFMLPPLTAEPFLWQPVIPARAPQPSRGRRQGTCSSFDRAVALEAVWYQTVRFCDTKLRLHSHTDCSAASQQSPPWFSTYLQSAFGLLEGEVVPSTNFIHR